MHALVKPFFEICLMRLGPQHLPASGMLLVIALTAHTVTAMLISIFTLTARRAVLAGVLDTILLCALTASLLYIQRLNIRVIQTLTALAGSGAIISLIALPVSGWLHGAHEAGGESGMAIVLLLLLTGWSLAVAAHILRHALSIHFFLGLVIAIVFYWISITIFRTLFPLGA